MSPYTNLAFWKVLSKNVFFFAAPVPNNGIFRPQGASRISLRSLDQNLLFLGNTIIGPFERRGSWILKSSQRSQNQFFVQFILKMERNFVLECCSFFFLFFLFLFVFRAKSGSYENGSRDFKNFQKVVPVSRKTGLHFLIFSLISSK